MALTRPTTTQVKPPNHFRHKIISFVKSAIRIVALGFLAYYEVQLAAILLIIAEFLGVYEEMV